MDKLIIGIPSLNEADNIGALTQTLDQAAKQIRGFEAIIVNSDNRSKDHTADVFRSTTTTSRKISVLTPPGVVGKGANVRNILGVALDEDAVACLLVDADIENWDLGWVQQMVEPIRAQGADYVFPQLRRHRFDGNLTDHFARPLIYT